MKTFRNVVCVALVIVGAGYSFLVAQQPAGEALRSESSFGNEVLVIQKVGRPMLGPLEDVVVRSFGGHAYLAFAKPPEYPKHQSGPAIDDSVAPSTMMLALDGVETILTFSDRAKAEAYLQQVYGGQAVTPADGGRQ